jgi:hypothetical protein
MVNSLQNLLLPRHSFCHEMSLEAVNDPDFLLPPHPNIKPLAYWHSILAIADFLIIAYVAVDSVKCYCKGRTWATFFLARLGVAGFLFQFINATSLCLALWPPAYGIRIMWFMGPLGTFANLALNVWRVRIFEFVLPRTVSQYLTVKFITPLLSTICFITCLPLYFWIFGTEMYSSSSHLQRWANYGFTTWINFWTIADVICAVVSLSKVSQVVINAKEKYAKRCKFLLILLIVIDVYSLMDICVTAASHGFPYPRESMSILFSLAILHIAVSYFYMVNIVKYIVKTGNTAPKEKTHSRNRDVSIPSISPKQVENDMPSPRSLPSTSVTRETQDLPANKIEQGNA